MSIDYENQQAITAADNTEGSIFASRIGGKRVRIDVNMQSNDPLYGVTYDELSKVITAAAFELDLTPKQYVVNQLTRIYEEENAQKQAAVDKERQRDAILRELDQVAEKVRTYEAVIRDVDTAMNSLFVLNHIKTASALQAKSRNLQRSLATYKNHAAALRAKLDAFE